MVRFKAFDTDHSGALDRGEVSEVLLSSGIPKQRCQEVLDTMFQNMEREDEEMTWEVFRLWLRRESFADRKLCWQEQVYFTFDEPGENALSKVKLNDCFL